MRSLSGKVLSSDHTFKIASFVWLLKNQPFGAFWAVLNLRKEIEKKNESGDYNLSNNIIWLYIIF